VGFKYASGGSRFNIAGFYYDYKDLQVQTNQGLLSILENAANSEIYGIDADGAISLGSGLNLNGSVTYLHARYKNYIGSTNIPQPGGGNATGTADLSGNRNVRSPTWTATLGASYEHDVGAGILSLNGNVFYSSKFYFDAPNRIVQDEYAIVNANIGLALHNSGVKLTIWGKNLTNSKTIMSTNIGGLADGVSYAAPRTFGVQVGYTF
jgi:iron complex outermembrane recepter protein